MSTAVTPQPALAVSSSPTLRGRAGVAAADVVPVACNDGARLVVVRGVDVVDNRVIEL